MVQNKNTPKKYNVTCELKVRQTFVKIIRIWIYLRCVDLIIYVNAEGDETILYIHICIDFVSN